MSALYMIVGTLVALGVLVTFHEFGRLFRDGLGARDALYFDGSISRLYAPALNRADFGRRLGPIIGYTEQE